MAFTSTIERKGRMGVHKFRIGTYTSTLGSEGGNIDTGMPVVYSMKLMPKTTAVLDDESTVYETMPCDGTAVTIVTTADETGYWFAIGK
jgi:hypothetical protein